MARMIQARQYIRPTTNTTRLYKKNAGVPEILEVIFEATKHGPGFTKPFADKLRGANDRATAEKIWRFVKSNVIYKRDKPGKEVVKSPGKLVYDGSGDCKSFSVIIGSLLTNLGIPWFYRVAFYDKRSPNAGHIYPVAVINGREVIVDAVHDTFDEQVDFWKATDYSPDGSELQKLKGGSINGPGEGKIIKTVALLALLYIILK